MTMYSRFNKGYVTSEDNQEVELPVGTIYLDSNHSPVSRINYEIENSRVDQKTDYDRLNFELWTNGSVKPADSLAYAAKIIKEHMEVFINFDESSIKDEPEDEVEDEPLNENNSQDEKFKQHMSKDFVRFKMNSLYMTSWIYNFLIGII